MNDAYRKDIELALTGTAWTMPEAIGEWLGRLLLLYGVPFNYLVPHEAMLPPGSIRFFALDPGWMHALLEGASSIGKSSSLDHVFDQRLRNAFLDLAGKNATDVRQSLVKSNEQAPASPDTGPGQLHWPLTGFLMRSELVEGWQGLDIHAAGVDGQGNRLDPLQTLRIDRLSPEILFCLFNGKVTDIEITQPPEGLHFGAESQGNNVYKKLHLRHIIPTERIGDQIAKNMDLTVPMRQGSSRVVNVQALAKQIEQALRSEQAIDGECTSAEFAVQMVESPGRARFKAPQEQPR
ncbi:MAG: hypothetical protein IT391_15230 [Nitrospira sp.]|nr:hypothetical protein [Nitrospira sp.]